MSFFKSVGKALGNVGKIGGKVLKTVAPIASIVPGLGTLIAVGANVVGNVLDPQKTDAIVEAVERDGVVKVEKIEQTIIQENPHIDTATLQVATKAVTQRAVEAVPTATIDDSKSLTNVSTVDKIVQWVKSNIVLALGGVVAVYLLMTGKKKNNFKSNW